MLMSRLFFFCFAALTYFEFSIAVSTRECILEDRPTPNCRGTRYQTLDGSCNNPIIPFSGRSQTPYKRLLEPVYGNKIDSSRLSTNGDQLPFSRMISNAFNSFENNTNPNSSKVNAMFVQFGQFLIHDLSSAATVAENNCNCSEFNVRCLTITIPPGDPFYRDRLSCLNAKGSLRASGCSQLPAEQVNKLSAYLDAEHVYGWNEELLESLRDPDSDHGALLLISPDEENDPSIRHSDCPMHRNKKLLQSVNDLKPELAKRFACPANQRSPICFVSGEDRINENIGLSSTHLVFTREHNRIAKRLKTLNSQWDSDKCFNEARRIIIAMNQIISYGEFLPLLVGPKLMKDFDLEIVQNGFYFGYDPTYDATISNEFTTAAFRYGHSQVGKFFLRLQSDYEREAEPAIPMVDGLFFQEAVLNGTSSSIMRGLMVDPARVTDLNFVSDLRDEMFRTATFPGLDLFSINIQRGRDHGIPSYNMYRDFCGLPKAFAWSDFYDTIPQDTVEILRFLYNDVNDVDLYAGGVAELPLPQANVGPTFGCIIAYQFRDLRKGDRYWFENPGQFTEAQLREIRKITLSSVLCSNLNEMVSIFPRAMELESESNARINCSQVPQINLESWRDFNYKQDGVMTRWFPTETNQQDKILQSILSREPESVCTNPLGIEMEPIQENSNSMKVRYRCPTGSVKATAFPNVKNNFQCSWTTWFDYDSPGTDGNDFESVAVLRAARPEEICKQPLLMQAITRDGISAFDSNEVFLYLNARQGLACRGSDQRSGMCRDYRVRFYCPNDFFKQVEIRNLDLASNFATQQWTPWINLDKPDQSQGDFETIPQARVNGFTICRKPLRIEGRVFGSNISAPMSGDVLQRYSIYNGLICQNEDQFSGSCQDYEVRYLCPVPEN